MFGSVRNSLSVLVFILMCRRVSKACCRELQSPPVLGGKCGSSDPPLTPTPHPHPSLKQQGWLVLDIVVSLKKESVRTMRVLEQNKESVRTEPGECQKRMRGVSEKGECQNRTRRVSEGNKESVKTKRVLEQNKESVRTEQREC